MLQFTTARTDLSTVIQRGCITGMRSDHKLDQVGRGCGFIFIQPKLISHSRCKEAAHI
jgi:hypothetical protein